MQSDLFLIINDFPFVESLFSFHFTKGKALFDKLFDRAAGEQLLR